MYISPVPHICSHSCFLHFAVLTILEPENRCVLTSFRLVYCKYIVFFLGGGGEFSCFLYFLVWSLPLPCQVPPFAASYCRISPCFSRFMPSHIFHFSPISRPSSLTLFFPLHNKEGLLFLPLFSSNVMLLHYVKQVGRVCGGKRRQNPRFAVQVSTSLKTKSIVTAVR